MATAKLSICVPVYNNANNIKNLYYSLACTSDRRMYEVIVYNDGSPFGGIDAELRAFCLTHDIRYEAGSTNRGVAHAWNRLAELAREELVLVTNDDVRACGPGWLEPLTYAFDNNERLGLAYWCQKRIDASAGTSKGLTRD